MATPKTGKKDAKKKPAAAKKKAPAKKAAAKKAAPKKVTAKKAAVEPIEKSKLVTPEKGDIVKAMGKFFLVISSSKRKGTLVGAQAHMIECGMTGVNWHREITWDLITMIYKDAGYRG